MPVRLAINGFGRIGRLVCRIACKTEGIELVAVNDLAEVDHLAYLLKYDTVHGRFEGEVSYEENFLIAGGKKIAVYQEKEPEKLPWRSLQVDYVVESTGKFRKKEELEKHLKAGAKRVLLSAPGKGEGIPTYVVGVNHREYDAQKEQILCNASCTTNCLAPLVKVLWDHFGIEEGLMTTVHSLTASQPTVDGPSEKDWRGGRAAGYNIIPSSTGAAKAVVECLPEMKGKITGMAFRVPCLDVSVVDLTVRLKKKTSYEEICKVIRQASEKEMKGIIEYTEEEVVSSDFIGSSSSCIFDKKAGISLNPCFYKLVAWYDNEMAYAHRLIDLICHMASKE